jgi:DNA-binding transcriptional MerR regulator
MRDKLRPIDVARQLGRSVAWLYTLERRGIIPSPERDPMNGRRTYPPEAVEQIRETLIARASTKV